jgi:AraC-like DNA-binding protein
MPELDGFSLLARLRDDPRTSHVPVLLLTARADLDSRIAGYEAGTDAFLAKPFRGAELLARLHALLEQRRRLRRAFSKVVLHPEEVDVPDREREFLDRLRTAMEAGLAEPRFNVDELAAELFMSRRQLLRKVQALTGEAPGDLLRRLRLERATALLRGGASVKEVARAVGFRSASHFTQAFREAHGVTPAAWRAELVSGGLPPD